MTIDDTQAVADDADAGAKEPPAEDQGAQDEGDDLGKLLTEFDEGVAPQVPEQKADHKPADTAEDVDAKIEAAMARLRAQEQSASDFNAVVKAVKADDLAGLSDTLVRGWIEERARSDDRLIAAWNGRSKNPAAWNAVVNSLGKEFRKELGAVGKVDDDQTQTIESVTAAVRGSSTKAPDYEKPPDFGSMSDAEIAAMKMKLNKVK